MVDTQKAESLAKRLSKNLSDRRKKLGLTQEKIAGRVGLDTESVSRFERGKTLPSLATLERLAIGLETTIADLLSEYPGSAYTPAERIGGLLAQMKPGLQEEVIAVIEHMCRVVQLGQPKDGSTSTMPAAAEAMAIDQGTAPVSAEEEVSQPEAGDEQASEGGSASKGNADKSPDDRQP